MSKEMHLTALVYSTGLHPDSWRLPNSHVEELGSIDFQIRMAKLAERGKLDAFFLVMGNISQKKVQDRFPIILNQ